MRTRSEVLVVILICTVAIGLRFVALDTAPGGLLPAEAMNGNNAIRAADTGDFKVYYDENGGREGLFMNAQAIMVRRFGNTAGSLRAVAALAGVLTVLGTYLLTRRLFDQWGMAALASTLMAVGFWHVLFSRIGLREILAPLFAVWALYYLYTALKGNRLWHWGLSGLFMGLGVHSFSAFKVMPLVALVVLLVYWHSVRKDFHHRKYLFTRRQVVGGILLGIAIFVLVAAPLMWHFANSPTVNADYRAGASILTSDDVIGDLASNIVRTFSMFVFSGDIDWRYNLPGEPILFWPVAALFVVGLGRSLLKVGRVFRTHGHFSSVHALLLGWFFIGLLPAVTATQNIPSARVALLVAPVVYIFAGDGLWWLFGLLRRSYDARDSRMVCMPEFLVPGSHGHQQCTSRSLLVSVFTLVVFLFAVGAYNTSAYFHTWVGHPFTLASYHQEYVGIVERIDALPYETKKYIVVEATAPLIPTPDAEDVGDAVSLSAQPIMFLTDTWTPEKRREKNIVYVSADAFQPSMAERGSVIFRLP